MTANEITLMMNAVGFLITSVIAAASFVSSLVNTRKLNMLKTGQEEQHKATNSRLDELVKVTGEKEFARGEKSEVDKTKGVTT